MGKAIPREEIRASAGGPRSPLFAWMRDNHDTFAEDLAEAGNKPNWARLAALFAACDVFDAHGKPPSAEVARLTWYKVRRLVKSRRAKLGTPMLPTPPSEAIFSQPYRRLDAVKAPDQPRTPFRSLAEPKRD